MAWNSLAQGVRRAPPLAKRGVTANIKFSDPAVVDGGTAMESKQAKFTIGQVVKHRVFPFRGVIFDVDPVFSNSEEWYQAIPAEVRPSKDQPFYHLLAENAESYYVAYVSEQEPAAGRQGRAGWAPDRSAVQRIGGRSLQAAANLCQLSAAGVAALPSRRPWAYCSGPVA